MRSTIVLSSLAALAAAAPQPIANLNSLFKRGSCAAQPDGYGPKTNHPDTATAFLANHIYRDAAENAKTPSGYHQSFVSLQSATSTSNYLTYYELKSYDPCACQAKCDAVTGCKAFNLYFERDPTVDPDTTNCPNPPSFTNVKCSLWGTTITSASATNIGQYRAGFQVVIAGSNGYNKLPPTPPAQPGFDRPIALSGAITVNALPDPSTYMGVKFQAGTSLNTTFCATECIANTAYDRANPQSDGLYAPCNFFNAWLGLLAGVPDGTHCAEFTQPWGKPYDTNMGQYQGNAYLNVTQSFGYSANPQDPGPL